MATITAQAKIYNGFRVLCVDKNITANLTGNFSVGNYNRPIQPNDQFVITANILGIKAMRTAAGLEAVSSLTLVDERYKTYGGGNNVISANGTVNNTNNWKVISSIKCDFPTYVRFDLETLGVPEGTDIIIQLEEGFVIEGDYPGTENKFLPRVDNLFQFRTPKKFAFYPSAAFNFTIPNFRLRRFDSAVGSLFTPSILARANKRGVIELESFASLNASLLEIRRFFASQMFARFGPIGPGDEPYLEGNGYPVNSGLEFWPQGFPGITRIRRFESTNNQIVSDLTLPEFLIILFGESNLTSTVNLTNEIQHFIGIISNQQNNVVLNSSPVKTSRVSRNLSTTTTMATTGLKVKQLASTNNQITSSMSITTIDSPMVFNVSTPSNIILELSGTVNCVIRGPIGTPITATSPGSYAVQANLGDGRITITGTLTGFNGVRDGAITRLQSFGDLPLTDVSNACFTTAVGYTNELNQIPYKFPSTITNTSGMFRGRNLNNAALPQFGSNLNFMNNWNVSNVTNMSSMFRGTIFNADLSAWNTSKVTNMSFMFNNATSFNGNIGNWNTGLVTTTESMFEGATSFNQPIGSWNMSSLITTESMFEGATSFNQPIGSWNTLNVTNMTRMFRNATAFNQSLNSWNTAKVTTMLSMFQGAIAFNGGCANWTTTALTNVASMFEGAVSFNQPIGIWNVSQVTGSGNTFSINLASGMANMFKGATAFNQPLNTWNVSNVRIMASMFEGATAFNQPLNAWDMRNVVIANDMFRNATSFNGNITTWNFQSGRLLNSMFSGATNFNQNLGGWGLNPTYTSNAVPSSSTRQMDMTSFFNGSAISVENYSRTLIGWANFNHFQNGGMDNPFFVRFSSPDKKYDSATYTGFPYNRATDARAYLVLNTPNVAPGGGKKWTIVDGGLF